MIAGRSVNKFLKPRLKEWITQLWREATTARLLTGPLHFLPCLVEDGIRSSFHVVANGLKSNGKVLMIIGAFLCATVFLTPYCKLLKDACPQTFVILTIGLGIFMVFAAHSLPLSQVMMCCASFLLLFCCTLLCADVVKFSFEHMEYISITSSPASEVDSCQKLPSVSCILTTILTSLAIIILEGHDNGVESMKHGAGCSNTQLRRLSTKIDHIPYKVMSRLCWKLDIKRDMHFDDFRMLGEKAGLDRDLINCIAQYENPTQKILMEWSSHPEATVGKLIELLKEDDLGRMDVAEVLEDWVNGEQ